MAEPVGLNLPKENFLTCTGKFASTLNHLMSILSPPWHGQIVESCRKNRAQGHITNLLLVSTTMHNMLCSRKGRQNPQENGSPKPPKILGDNRATGAVYATRPQDGALMKHWASSSPSYFRCILLVLGWAAMVALRYSERLTYVQCLLPASMLASTSGRTRDHGGNSMSSLNFYPTMSILSNNGIGPVLIAL
jgi:hypothetical protein